MFERVVQKSVETMLRAGTGVQAPLAAKYVDRLRRRHPERTPGDIERGLQWRYLAAVTTSGTLAGLSAAVPGIGTIIGLGVSGLESVFFMEASALYAVSVGELHGMSAMSQQQRRALVVAVVLGEGGAELLGKSAGQSAKDWASAVADKLPVVRSIDNPMARRFVVGFIAKRGALLFGRALPAGIGAIIGGTGNFALGRAVLANAGNAFGTAPADWHDAAGDLANSTPPLR
ncbi:hypothetical protein NONO_c57510 [Nocardia nova SH22a]|uniref:EcsC family protein n=1 Tax=Nocardia nova SH22a TaxID=1415166 RepID=W5TN28_9NOCA|nr:hypothetical protein [Nocardia nova]AHH20529.1 hypothetical protein NONO_c57510 [Nocardia nova SH22a]